MKLWLGETLAHLANKICESFTSQSVKNKSASYIFIVDVASYGVCVLENSPDSYPVHIHHFNCARSVLQALHAEGRVLQDFCFR